jgi:vancomycin aglycone glucosyltransferase
VLIRGYCGMRVLLATYDSRGGVEPLAGLAVRLRALGHDARIAAPPDCAQRLAEVDVPLVPVGMPVRALVHGAKPPSVADIPRRAAELTEAWFAQVLPAADGCDVLLASGVIPVVAASRSIAERIDLPFGWVNYCPIFVPSPHFPVHPAPGRPFPADVTDRVAQETLARAGFNEIFGAALNTHRRTAGLAPVDDVLGHILSGRTWLAADPVLAPWITPAEVDVVQTGAWILPDERPLPADVQAFLDAGEPPVFMTFGSQRAPEEFARVAVESARAHGRRVILSRGWSGLAPPVDGDDCLSVGEINQQALFRRVAAAVHHGGAGTTHTATRAGAPQVVVPLMGDQPYFAARVAALGIGAAHDGPTPSVGSLTAALDIALAPGTVTRAAEVAPTIRTDGTELAVRELSACIR